MDTEMVRPIVKKNRWWKSAAFKIYLSHILSSWGDRMWQFAVGVYLYYLYPDSLQLTAVYGFSTCVSVIALGATIGRWVDKTQRLRAAQVSLIIQNLAVILCASLLVLKLEFNEEIDKVWNGALEILIIGIIIVTGVVADLASVATKIALEKDWIVVLSEGNENKLAKMNSTMRTIDLTTSILAPIIVGQILTFRGKIFSAVFIFGWNVVSVTVEYYLLISLYKQMPELGRKGELHTSETLQPGLQNERFNTEEPGPPTTHLSQEQLTPNNNSIAEKPAEKLKTGETVQTKHKTTCLSNIKTKIVESAAGWKSYFHHYVRNAGLGLALLYMTVLGFDNITRGYALSQRVSESLLGVFTAIGAIFGILGSLSFPYLRKTFGKLTTGNIGFCSETLCLLICVASIFTLGSPFEHYNFMFTKDVQDKNSTGAEKPYSLPELWDKNISVLLLLTGIVLARFGLWVADLSISQIFQENIAENQRGVLNGVQDSLNQGMNLVKFILVIVLPNPQTFAYLVTVSWLSILLGWIFFMAFTCSKHPTIESAKFDKRAKAAHIPTISLVVDIAEEGEPVTK